MKRIFSTILFFMVVLMSVGIAACRDKASNNQRFVNNQVCLTISREASFTLIDGNLKMYSPDDFFMVDCIEISEITMGTTEMIFDFVAATGRFDMQEIGEYMEANTLTIFDNLRRQFCLTLSEKSCKNVLNACDRLNQVSWIDSAEPNYIFSLL